MTQPILIGLVAAIASLAAAVLALIGVLVTTNVNYKLGLRTGDIAEQAAEDARTKQTGEENQHLRDEIAGLWKTNQGLRQTVADKDEVIAALNAQVNVALRAQDRAEGGLVATRQTIQDLCPPAQGN